MPRKKEIIGISRDYPVTAIQYDWSAIEHNKKIDARNRFLFIFFVMVPFYLFTVFLFWLGVKTALHYGDGWGAMKLLLLGIVWHVIQSIIAKVIIDSI